MKVLFHCEQCNKEIVDYAVNRRWKHVFCSQSCKGKWYFTRSNPAKLQYVREILSIQKIGRKNPRYGKDPWNKDNFDSHSYYSAHQWVIRNLGQSNKCEHCGNSENIECQWANISYQYKQEAEDWIRLCRRCHTRFDRANGWGEAKKYREEKRIRKNIMVGINFL